jgi:hypothetical protein
MTEIHIATAPDNGARNPHALQKLFNPRSAHYVPRSGQQRIHQHRNSPLITNRPANVHGGNKNITIFIIFTALLLDSSAGYKAKETRTTTGRRTRPEGISEITHHLAFEVQRSASRSLLR